MTWNVRILTVLYVVLFYSSPFQVLEEMIRMIDIAKLLLLYIYFGGCGQLMSFITLKSQNLSDYLINLTSN